MKKRYILGLIVLLFFLVIIYPNSGLRFETLNAKNIRTENRNITTIPEGSWTKKDFYRQLELWYQDRLALRSQAIDIWWKYQYEWFGVVRDPNIVLAEDGWMLDKKNSPKRFIAKEEKIKRILEIKNFCEENGAEFIVLIPPYKETIYREKFPEYFRRATPNPLDFHREFDRLCIENHINNVEVSDVLMDAKKNGNDLYFKDDHHWSYYGAALAGDLLLKEISKLLGVQIYDGMNLYNCKAEAFKECSYANAIKKEAKNRTEAPWDEKFTKEIYLRDCDTGKENKVNGVVSNDLLYPHLTKDEAVIVNKTIQNDLTILVLGDSYSSYMAPYVTQYVNCWAATHYRGCSGKKKNANLKYLIDRYHPRVVLLEIQGPLFLTGEAKRIFENFVIE